MSGNGMPDQPIEYPKSGRFTLEQKLRSAHVKRWQIVRVGREQTLAEHQYLVYQIASSIFRIIHEAEGVQPNSHYMIENRLCIDWALNHDQPEVVTGDIATPAKRAMREALPHGDPIRQIELQLDDGYARLYLTLKRDHPYILTIVKLADILEAMRFLAFEGQGTQAANALEGLFRAYLEVFDEAERQRPDLGWAQVGAQVLKTIVVPELSHEMRVRFIHAGQGRAGGL